MRTSLLFLHYLGFALWIGGAMAGMAMRIGSRRESPETQGAVARLLARVQIFVVAPGALLSLASGFGVAFNYMAHGATDILGAPLMSAMMGFGTLGALLVLFVGMPTAQRIAALAYPNDQGTFPSLFGRLQKRQAIVQTVAGVMALAALICGALWRP
jgi:hypothetical protein